MSVDGRGGLGGDESPSERTDPLLPVVGVPPPSRRRGGWEYRPTISPTSNGLSLTGLTRRSWSRVGSRAFTLVFVAIFVLILVQAVASVLTAGS
ncbi:MAG: hypothetical protein JO100_15380 [Pseudonocardia sp.]|nr:hypothetical protein [Pseudonocardia sp.]